MRYTKFILAPRATRLEQKELRASSWRHLKTLINWLSFHTANKNWINDSDFQSILKLIILIQIQSNAIYTVITGTISVI